MLLLDDARNDIYLHIDAKVEKFDFVYFENLMKRSTLYYVKRLDVRWGNISIVHCVVNLLKVAFQTGGGYEYYHLLSGVDLPLKTQDDIHKFLKENHGKEYIHFSPKEMLQNVQTRYDQFHIFTRYLKDKNILLRRTCKCLNFYLLFLQRMFKFNREKCLKEKIQYGSAWFSVTESFVEYILENKEWIDKMYKYTLLPDESFLQTLFYNSYFYKRIFLEQEDDDHFACLREIDWKRGGPYVWRKDDYQYLLKSRCLFARKFDTNVDKDIVDALYNHLINKGVHTS